LTVTQIIYRRYSDYLLLTIIKLPHLIWAFTLLFQDDSQLWLTEFV
ncbi:hypothetical protein YPPY19_2886, partial [Yersinia pestis PY-19]